MCCCRSCTCAASRRGDFAETLAALLGKDVLSLPATIDLAVEGGADRRAHALGRSAIFGPPLCLRLGGRHLRRPWLEDEKQCILVLIGATPEGKKELLGFTDGARESAQDWSELLLDLKARGLTVSPKLAVADGALGFWKGARLLRPTCTEQRCWCTRSPTS